MQKNYIKYDYLSNRINSFSFSSIENTFVYDYKDDIITTLKSLNPIGLIFIFPFIEKIFRNLLNYNPYFNVEVYEQGKYRPMRELLIGNQNLIKSTYGIDIYYRLLFVYDTNAIRDKLLHLETSMDFQKFELLSIKFLLLDIIGIYKTVNKVSAEIPNIKHV